MHITRRLASSQNLTKPETALSVPRNSIFRVHFFYWVVLCIYVHVMQRGGLKFSSASASTWKPLSFADIDADVFENGAKRSDRMLQSKSESIKRRKLPSRIPSCASDLYVELQDGQAVFLCWGLLLRDDMVLADGECARTVRTAIVVEPTEQLLMYHNQASATRVPKLRAVRSTKTVSKWTSLLKIDMPVVHYQSGWPRQRLFVLDHEGGPDPTNSSHSEPPRALQGLRSSTHLESGLGESLHLECMGDRPVVSLLQYDEDDHRLLNLNHAKLDHLHYPQHKKAPTMTNVLGERWWVRRKDSVDLVQDLFARRHLFTSADPYQTVDIIRAEEDQYMLEADDPMTRNSAVLWEFFLVWKQERPFSGEPFFQWLDFGSGRVVAAHTGSSRNELDSTRCTVMTEADRSRAVVVPKLEDGAVFLRYELYDLAVESGSMLFVWGTDGKLYVARNKGWAFHHICFFGGKPVRMAGELYVGKHGMLLEMTSDSGHYKPTDSHFRQLYRYLKNNLPGFNWRMIDWKKDRASGFRKKEEWRQYLES